MKYLLIDIDDNEYELNGELVPSVIGNSLSYSSDEVSFVQEVIEKSFLPGSAIVGTSRVEARSLEFIATFTFTSDEEYDTYFNSLLYEVGKTIKIKDVKGDKETKIAVSAINIEFDNGCLKRSGTYILNLLQLDGYWEDSTPTIATTTVGVGLGSLAISNTGFLPTYCKISIEVYDKCDELDLYLDENKEGLQLIDESFGTATLDQLEIDNEQGTLTITDFDRSQNITPGSGYFAFPVGDSTLIIETLAALEITVSYKMRYFV